MRPLALLFEPDARRREKIAGTLTAAGCAVEQLNSLAPAADVVAQRHPDLVIIAVGPASADEALASVARLRATDRRLPVFVIAQHSSESLAVSALRAGVKDYFSDPVDAAALEAAVRQSVTNRRPPDCRTATRVADRRARGHAREALIGSTPVMRAVCDYIDRVAKVDSTVLITGETGTGKELAARRIHDVSPRRRGPFVSVNCAAIPEGLLESELFGYEPGAFTGASRSHEGLLQVANGGTVLLDEIGDMGSMAQAKMLRAIETREVHRLGGRRAIPVDVRVVAATNQDLERTVDEGRFRKDLYFRLNVARVHLPPLRERRADIPAILDHYLQALNAAGGSHVEGFAPGALEALVAYDWPGNVRELKNLVERVFVAPPGGPIAVEDLPPEFRTRLNRYCALPNDERGRLMDALLAADWNKSRAAEMLQWSRMTVYRKMAKYSVEKSSPPTTPLRRR